MLNQILFLGLTYAISAIPFGLVLSKIFAKTDIRDSGSKNIGATNVARVLGKKLGFATLMLDGLKGAVMVVIARFQFLGIDNLHLFLLLVSAVAVLGHIFPIYLRFKGGKGVATTIAVLFALDLKLGLSVVVVWVVCFFLVRISSVSSLSAIFSAALFSFLYKSSVEQTILCCFLFLLVLIRHKENIVRLISGEEKKISK
jgi:acyl phosphate:glycerol-3-phosphate acyltransferase